MKVGLMADSHDRIPAVAELLKLMREAGATMVLHAGDYVSPLALKPFEAFLESTARHHPAAADLECCKLSFAHQAIRGRLIRAAEKREAFDQSVSEAISIGVIERHGGLRFVAGDSGSQRSI